MGKTSASVQKPPSKEALRLHAATLIVEAGRSYASVCEELGVSERAVRGWVTRYRKGIRCFADAPKSGRPRSVRTTALLRKAEKTHREKRHQSTRKTAAKLQTSRSTIRRCLKDDLELRPARVTTKPGLSEKNIADRLAFARRHTDSDWTKFMFTDEKDFWLFAKPHKKNDVVWVGAGDKKPTPAPAVRGAKKVHIWAGITTHGKTRLHCYNSTLNAAAYHRHPEEGPA
eukprot:TRINITY_DN10430_c0_g1_i4.p1 TRINITY_DN10430_c0_g1~~TRINITY_DN10430_c0_g1_i4.p1  ORF type:complete len:229 (-),score=27.77 TRINITY_DN10430_c0_g1_i4:1086-1772(-)